MNCYHQFICYWQKYYFVDLKSLKVWHPEDKEIKIVRRWMLSQDQINPNDQLYRLTVSGPTWLQEELYYWLAQENISIVAKHCQFKTGVASALELWLNCIITKLNQHQFLAELVNVQQKRSQNVPLTYKLSIGAVLVRFLCTNYLTMVIHLLEYS